jgi:hypothetical protein
LAVPVGIPALAVVAAVVVAITVLSSTLFKSWGRRESAATSAPVQDEAVQALLGMNQTKNTSSSPAQGFFSPLLCPKIFPSYLIPPFLPTSPLLPHSPHFLLMPSPDLGRALKLNSTEL